MIGMEKYKKNIKNRERGRKANAGNKMSLKKGNLTKT